MAISKHLSMYQGISKISDPSINPTNDQIMEQVVGHIDKIRDGFDDPFRRVAFFAGINTTVIVK